MMLTGAFLYFPPLALYLDRPTAKMLHLWAAIALPAGWLVLTILGDRRALGRTLREADRFDRDDVRWLKGGPRRLVNRDHEPPQGRLNAGQKMNLAITMGLLVVLGVSGTLLWLGERDTDVPVRRQRPRARSRHARDHVPDQRPPLPGADPPGHEQRAVGHHERVGRPGVGTAAPPEVGRGRRGAEAASGAAEEAPESALPAALGEQLSER